jgi:hypothetical protein
VVQEASTTQLEEGNPMSGISEARPRALVVGPAFFGYESAIVAELDRQGYESEFFDERPSNGSLARAVVRVRKSLMDGRIRSHYQRGLESLAGRRFDVVLVIKGEVVPRWFLEELRSLSPAAHFVFYTFDSLSNAGNCLDIVDLFDERLSFDRADVAASDGTFGYLPLFFTPEFDAGAGLADVEPRAHRLAFVGTLHSERFAFVKALFDGQLRTFAFFFVQARWYFAVVKYVTREHRTVRWHDVSFQPMARAQVAEVFRNTRAVLDLQRDGQTGLTMRTFEVLAAGAVLVTTNSAVKAEPFYDPGRIFVVSAELSRDDCEIVHRALDELADPVGRPDGFEKYSLESWVRQIAGGR